MSACHLKRQYETHHFKDPFQPSEWESATPDAFCPISLHGGRGLLIDYSLEGILG